MCCDAGVDVHTTAQWMGLSNVTATLKIYTKLSAEKHEESVEKMNDFVSEVR
jgi:site-specific recombinase XerD